MKRTLAVAAAATLLVFGAAPAAHAGEITGGKDPKPTPISRYYDGKASPNNSVCAFSGLDDVDEGEGTIPDDFGRTQSFGQIPRGFRPPKGSGFHPGDVCKFTPSEIGE